MRIRSDQVVKWSLLAAFAFAGTGCSSLSKKNASSKSDWSITKLWKEEFQRPSSMAAIWTYDELIAENRPAERGFGGRIYFYNERSQAIPVDGDLMVHGYVTTPKYAAEDKVAPDKKFEFPAEKLSSHFSPSDIGASYSIWVPWDALGGYREEITLIPTFKSKDGALVQGTPAKVFLKGRAREESHLDAPSIQQVSYQRSSGAEQGANGVVLGQKGKTRTTTIGLPTNVSGVIGNQYKAHTNASPKSMSTKSIGKRESFTLTSTSLVKPKAQSNPQVNPIHGSLKASVLQNATGPVGNGTATGSSLQKRQMMPGNAKSPAHNTIDSYELRSLQAPALPTRTPTASLPSARDLEKGILGINATRGQSA